MQVFIQNLLMLFRAGYGVYAHDHKGMENSEKKEDYGHFEPNVGWNQVVSDVIFVSEMIKEEQTCPLFYSDIVWDLLSRRAVQLRGELYDGFLISGTGGNPGF